MPKSASERRRCQNCDSWFDVNPMAPLKKFCKDACRKAYWQLGGIPRKVIQYVDKTLPELVARRFDIERGRLEEIRDEIQSERFLIQGLVAKFENARQAQGDRYQVARKISDLTAPGARS